LLSVSESIAFPLGLTSSSKLISFFDYY